MLQVLHVQIMWWCPEVEAEVDVNALYSFIKDFKKQIKHMKQNYLEISKQQF